MRSIGLPVEGPYFIDIKSLDAPSQQALANTTQIKTQETIIKLISEKNNYVVVVNAGFQLVMVFGRFDYHQEAIAIANLAISALPNLLEGAELPEDYPLELEYEFSVYLGLNRFLI